MSLLKQVTIVGLGGSPRPNSRTRVALQTALAIAAEQGAATHLLDLGKLALPMYQPHYALRDYSESEQQAITELLHWCREAHALIWASPTYHGTVSGIFKNALDFTEFLADDQAPYLQNRAVGLITISDPSTFVAMSHIARELRAWLAPTQITLLYADFTPEMQLATERAERRMQRLVNELLSFCTAHT